MSMQKNVLAIIVAALVVGELAIFLAAASQSGTEYRVVIEDSEGRTLYETPGKMLTYYEEMSFKNTFGPIENYQVRIITRHRPFPFTAWLAASVGIPMGLVLLAALIIRTYRAIYEYRTEPSILPERPDSTSRWKRLLFIFNSLSIFHLGFIVTLVALLVWLIPHVAERFIAFFESFIKTHALLSVILIVLFFALIAWVIYLKYRLSKEFLHYRYEIARLQLEKTKELSHDNNIKALSDFLGKDEEKRTKSGEDHPHEMV